MDSLNHFFDYYSSKRFTFLLATKNRPVYLEKSLNKNRQVVKKSDELIVIEGTPSVASKQVIQKFADLVDIYIAEKDNSEGEALNKGVLLARGKYIKLLTDDDIFYKSAIEKAYEVMEKYPEIDVLLCGGEKVKGKQITYAYAPQGAKYGKSVADIFKYGGNGLGMVIRRKSLTKIGLFNAHALSLDNDFLAQAIASGANVKFCRLKMFKHYIERHSTTIAKAEAMGRDFERIKRQYGVEKPNIILDARVKLSQLIFPRLPRSFHEFYLRTFKKKPKVIRTIKPIWDGGFS